MKKLQLAGLTARIVGPEDAKTIVVLLHGFGAPGDDLVGLADYIDAPVRFGFPEAPLELGGLYGDSRAWWMLDLAKLDEDLRTGRPRDRRGEVPEGLAPVRDQVSRMLDEVDKLGAEKLVLGGFSQGAMLSLDVALHRDTPPAGLVLMSGTLIAESEWEPRWPKLAGIPVLQSHGKHDALLPFFVAEALRDRLRDAGARVSWHEFPGAHEIPPPVLDALGTFLRTI